MTFEPRCWCGNTELEPFSPDYLRCRRCETLVCSSRPALGLLPENDGEDAYYGKSYWQDHQETDLGNPGILTRRPERFFRPGSILAGGPP